jgi:TolB-like protein
MIVPYFLKRNKPVMHSDQNDRGALQCSLILFFLVLLPEFVTAAPIGVLPFQMGSQQDQSVPSALVTALKQAGRYEIVEQSRLDDVLEELKRAQSGLVDSETAAQIGQLTGAQYLVVGEIHTVEGGIEAAYRVVHVETGLIVAADRSSGKREDVVQRLQESLLRQMDLYLGLDNPDSPYTVLLKIPDGPLKVGDTLTVRFKVISHRPSAPRRVYIQLYSINAKGVMTLIYPNRFSGFSPIEIDREYTFPSEKDDFEWELVPPTGVESIQAIVTTEPSDLFQVFQKARSTFPETNHNGQDPATYRGIQVQLNRNKRKDWKAQRITYELQP